MPLDNLPLWAFGILICIGVIAALESGYRLGTKRRRESEDEKESPVSAIAGALLGLTAFLLAFTFSIVSDRYDARRALVRDEANAIRTVWHRADFLKDGDRAEAKALLQRYVEARVDFALAHDADPEHIRNGLAEAQRIQNRLWAMAVADARKDMNSDVAALYIESLNELNSVHAQRVAVGLQARIPTEIWLALGCITVLGMVSVGYQTGIAGSRRSATWLILAIAFALVFALIAALDRPDTGILRVSQQPLIDLRGAMAGKA